MPSTHLPNYIIHSTHLSQIDEDIDSNLDEEEIGEQADNIETGGTGGKC